jgi:hypothetical protein
MLKLSVNTRLSPDQAIAKIIDHYVEVNGMKMVEARGHLHGTDGAVEVAAIGKKIGNGADWQQVLRSAMDHLKSEFELHPEYYVLHFHLGEGEGIGHLTAQVHTDKPTTVDFESVEVDEITRHFANTL